MQQAAELLQHSNNESAAIDTDALIIGAGPVGIFQAFQLGLLGIHAHIVDALPHAGGQCMELYPDKPIYDIPGIPMCTGRELTKHLLQQVSPFSPTFHLGQHISSFKRQADGRFMVESTAGVHFLAKTVFIAAGVGAFLPRTIALPGLNSLLHPQIAFNVADPNQATRLAIKGFELEVLQVDNRSMSYRWVAVNRPDPSVRVRCFGAAAGWWCGCPKGPNPLCSRGRRSAAGPRTAASGLRPTAPRLRVRLQGPLSPVHGSKAF